MKGGQLAWIDSHPGFRPLHFEVRLFLMYSVCPSLYLPLVQCISVSVPSSCTVYFCLSTCLSHSVYPFLCLPLAQSRTGELRTQKLKSHLVRTQSLNVLPLKPGVGQYIAIHATLTAGDFFFTYFYPSDPLTSIFS